MKAVAWEFADGSGGMREYDEGDAEAVAIGVCRAWPTARVWIGDEQLQAGFITSDELAAAQHYGREA